MQRTHGGVVALDQGSELPVELRDTKFQGAKQAIARAVAQRTPDERHAVALSGGTTTARVAVELTRHPLLTIVTNSLTIAELAHTHPALHVVVTGGLLRPQLLELVGTLAEDFGALNVGTAILGADGIAASAGVTTYDEIEARTNRAMVGSAERTIVVADGSKVGRLTLAQMVSLEEVEHAGHGRVRRPGEELERIRAAGVAVADTACSCAGGHRALQGRGVVGDDHSTLNVDREIGAQAHVRTRVRRSDFLRRVRLRD